MTDTVTLRTFNQMHQDCNKAGWGCAYWGERGEWLIVAGRSRDSEHIEESNFAAILAELGGESDTVAIERENHWAVGWVETLLVDPADTAMVERASALLERLADYPVLDEGDLSRREYDAFWESAESELGKYDGWRDEVQRQLDAHNSGIGDDRAESEVIERARENLTPAGRLKAAISNYADEEGTYPASGFVAELLVFIVAECDKQAREASKPAEMNQWAGLAHRVDELSKSIDR